MLLHINEKGLYCATGDFYIDPWRAVDRALITHAHSDHARPGSKYYLCATPGVQVLRTRLGKVAQIESIPYGESLDVRGVKISFHPAGHILGSAQIRLEYKGEVWVVTGDYKLEYDPTCQSFEPLKCHTLITESTFGLPVFQWQPVQEVFADINQWWYDQAKQGTSCVIYGYSLGKAQRILTGLNPDIGKIYTHNSIETLNEVYRNTGVHLPETHILSDKVDSGSMIITPPNAGNFPWMRNPDTISTAFASGWMAVRNARRRSNTNRSFMLSDHADWNGLLHTIRESAAEKVLVTHGFTSALVRYLHDTGIDAEELNTFYTGETAMSDEKGETV